MTLSFKQAKYIRFLIEAKAWGNISTFETVNGTVLPLADILNLRDEQKRSVYLDTRSPLALSSDDAKLFIESAKELPFGKSKEEFAAEKAAQAEAYKAELAAKAEVKAEVKAEAKPANNGRVQHVDPKSPSKDAPKGKVAQGFVAGKFTVGERPVSSKPEAGVTYQVDGATWKIVAKADKLGRIRLTVA